MLQNSDNKKSINVRLYRRFGKRAFDVIVSIGFLVFFCWLYIGIGIVVRIKMGSPIIYKSERIGKDENLYYNYKFRSMTNETDENGVLLPAEYRLTKFGRLLRSTSMDELPAIWNVLKGELSLIGPRPMIPKYLPFFYDHERVRHSVRPGLTGWAQVNGRNAISWDEKFELDVEYVEKYSFLFDLKIFFLTIVKVFKRSDIIHDNQQTESLHIIRADLVKDSEI